jgi:hypothetical protein
MITGNITSAEYPNKSKGVKANICQGVAPKELVWAHMQLSPPIHLWSNMTLM